MSAQGALILIGVLAYVSIHYAREAGRLYREGEEAYRAAFDRPVDAAQIQLARFTVLGANSTICRLGSRAAGLAALFLWISYSHEIEALARSLTVGP